MNIGIVTIVYNGYGTYVKHWLSSINQLTRVPTAITIVLGENHGLAKPELLLKKYPHLPIEFIYSNKLPRMGILRNVAVSNTKTKWIMYLSVDDVILPNAIEEFEHYEEESDWICIQWFTQGLGLKQQLHRGVTPYENYLNRKNKAPKSGFIISQSPYRRKLWELNHYEDHDYPNAPFIAGAVLNGARFTITDAPCTIYLRRPESHARTVLPHRNEKRQAREQKQAMERKIDAYYHGL